MPQLQLPATFLTPEEAPAPSGMQAPSAMAPPTEQPSRPAGSAACAPAGATRRQSGRHAARKQQPSTATKCTAKQARTPATQRRSTAEDVKVEEASTGKGSVLQAQGGCKRARRRRSSASLAALSSQSARTGEASLASRLAGPPPDAKPPPTGSTGVHGSATLECTQVVAQHSLHACGQPSPASLPALPSSSP